MTAEADPAPIGSPESGSGNFRVERVDDLGHGLLVARTPEQPHANGRMRLRITASKAACRCLRKDDASALEIRPEERLLNQALCCLWSSSWAEFQWSGRP